MAPVYAGGGRTALVWSSIVANAPPPEVAVVLIAPLKPFTAGSGTLPPTPEEICDTVWSLLGLAVGPELIDPRVSDGPVQPTAMNTPAPRVPASAASLNVPIIICIGMPYLAPALAPAIRMNPGNL